MTSHRLLVVDVETTGFNPAQHACVEIGAVLLDRTFRPVREFSSLIAPWEGAQSLEAAMKVNRISLQDLYDAPYLTHVIRRFDQDFGGHEELPLLAGWNVWFDVSFIRDLYRRADLDWPFAHRLLDVQSIFSFHSGISAMSQESAIQSLLNEQQAHRALADAHHTARLLKIMAERYLHD